MVMMHVWFTGLRGTSEKLQAKTCQYAGCSSCSSYLGTAQFKRFFDCGRAVRCMLPLGLGRFMHLVVLYGYQGTDTDAEQLALTEQLFDAALGELSAVARGQPCLLVGDLNVEPTKIPCLAKGISAVLWIDFEEAWALAAGLRACTHL